MQQAGVDEAGNPVGELGLSQAAGGKRRGVVPDGYNGRDDEQRDGAADQPAARAALMHCRRVWRR